MLFLCCRFVCVCSVNVVDLCMLFLCCRFVCVCSVNVVDLRVFVLLMEKLTLRDKVKQRKKLKLMQLK